MFDRVSIPTPFKIGPVNAYRVGRTVVDPGPDSERARETLRDALDAFNLSLNDIERVLITHPHPDHFGLARTLRDRGATVVASERAAPILEDFSGRLGAEQSYFAEFFGRCGLSQTTAQTVTALPDAFAEYAPSVNVDHCVGAGETLTLCDRHLDVLGVEGHAIGEICFAFDDGERRDAVVGDTVLPDTTPNPFLQPPPQGGAPRPRVLPAYNRSVRSLRERGLDRLYPGHGGVVDRPAARIDEILDANERRTEAVADVVDGPTSPHTVMAELFGDLPVTDVFAGMSEAVGHLDVLEARGEVEQTGDDQVRYIEV